MALRIDLDKTYLVNALDMAITSLKRARNSKKLNPAMDLLYEKDIGIYETAKAAMTEVK